MDNQKNSDSSPSVRIGMVNYINVAPIYETWKESVANPGWQVIEDVPAGLNEKLLAGEIDLGFVSSFAYGQHPERYVILPGLSISANGAVGSVFLFSHIPLEQLGGEEVLLTNQSATSVALTKVLLSAFFGVEPEYRLGDVMEMEKGGAHKAVLAIGDEALKLVENSNYLYQFDLGDIWKRETGLPFVYAVCAVRKEFSEEHPQELYRVQQELLRCRNEGSEKLDHVCEIVSPRIPMNIARCREYLSGIEYDLSAKKRSALEKFFTLLIEKDELPEDALPLKLFTYNPDE